MGECQSKNTVVSPRNQTNQNRQSCQVLECTEKHEQHYCKNCQDQDSNHLTRNCPEAHRQRQLQLNHPTSPNQTLENNREHFEKKMGCRAEDCTQNHMRHYCKVCQDTDSDHRAGVCPRGNQRNNNNARMMH